MVSWKPQDLVADETKQNEKRIIETAQRHIRITPLSSPSRWLPGRLTRES
jgi:ribosomal protein S2